MKTAWGIKMNTLKWKQRVKKSTEKIIDKGDMHK